MSELTTYTHISPKEINSSLTCYGCSLSKIGRTFRYLCSCDENKGVCKECINNNVSFEIPEDHSLVKLHDITPEYSKVMNDISKECGQWSGCSFGYNDDGTQDIIISYLKGPNGELDKDFYSWAEKNNVPLFTTEERDVYRRKYRVTLPKKSCTCCE